MKKELVLLFAPGTVTLNNARQCYVDKKDTLAIPLPIVTKRLHETSEGDSLTVWVENYFEANGFGTARNGETVFTLPLACVIEPATC